MFELTDFFFSFPACLSNPQVELCGFSVSDSCCTGFDVLLGYLVFFLNIELVLVYAAIIMFIAQFLVFLFLSFFSKQEDKEASK